MGLPVLVLGESGTGKSASLRNFPNDDVAVINVAGKPLPFKNKIQSETTDDYMEIDKHIRTLAKQGCMSIVVDDAQYLMANEFMRRATERGYDKFTDIAKNFWALINMVKELPDQVIVYFMAHIERDQNGNEKIKTIGKLLDEKITVEGMFTIVLKTNVTDGVYSFLTQNNGHDTVKSPIGMFHTYAIDNDLYYVDQKIRNYYDMDGAASDAEMAAADEEKANETVTKETAGEKKGRRSRKQSDSAEDTIKSADAESKTAEENPKVRKRKARVEETDESTSDKPDMNTPEEPKKEKSARVRRSRNVAKEEAANEMASEVAESGMGDMEDGEEVEVSFDESPEVPVPEAPTRRRRRRG